jgi:hypothetical protein
MKAIIDYFNNATIGEIIVGFLLCIIVIKIGIEILTKKKIIK